MAPVLMRTQAYHNTAKGATRSSRATGAQMASDSPSPFASIPDEVLYDERLTATDIRVYLEIEKRDGDEGCFADNATIAKRFGCSASTVNHSIRRLKEVGAIYVAERGPYKRVLRTTFRHPQERTEERKEPKPTQKPRRATARRATNLPDNLGELISTYTDDSGYAKAAVDYLSFRANKVVVDEDYVRGTFSELEDMAADVEGRKRILKEAVRKKSADLVGVRDFGDWPF